MKNWTKKDKIACIAIFAMSVIVAITFISTITMSYLFDTHSLDNTLTAGLVDFKFGGGTNNDGKFALPVLNPNNYYSGDDYTLTITNTSTSGAVFVCVKVETADYVRVLPYNNMWVGGTENNYYYYNGAISKSGAITFMNSFRTLDFNNTVGNAAESVNIKFIVTAIQAQGGACKALIESGTGCWAYAPETFKTTVTNYFNTNG